MANIKQSPSLSAKLKTKNAANKMKHGSPKLQEVLRQRCRERMREKRGQLFQRQRQGSMETDREIHDALTEIVRRELSQLATLDGSDVLFPLDKSISLSQDEALSIENEILAEEEQWILFEYDRIQNDEAEMWALFADESQKQNVFCPICEKGLIVATRNSLSCGCCDLSLSSKIRVEDFGKIIDEKVVAHSSSCNQRPSFMVLPESNAMSLYLTCEHCLFFALII